MYRSYALGSLILNAQYGYLRGSFRSLCFAETFSEYETQTEEN